MVFRVFSQFTLGENKYRIIETNDSTIVQILKPAMFDSQDEWIPLYSSLRSAHGLKACLNFMGLYVLNKQQEYDFLWNHTA